MRRCLLIAAMTLVLPLHASAESAPAEPAAADPAAAVEPAKAVLKQYLDALVKAGEGRKAKPQDVSKKLLGAKKYIHPKTLELIAQQEKNKVVTNGLAVWHWAKGDYWLKSYEMGEAQPAVLGTVTIEVNEKNWRVEEGGEDGEWEPTTYLLAQQKGAWVLVDKRRNGTFTADAIQVGYPGYFDAQKPAPAKEPAEPAGEK